MSTAFPTDFAARCGWYDGPDGLFLLSQVPEAYFGEPMLLIATGNRVGRLDPVDETHLREANGETLDLDSLKRSPRFVEEEVWFTVGDADLCATIITPATPGPHPAVVLVHGAAGGQRDFNRLFAQPFLDAGVAVLIYDKAGHGVSGGTAPTIFDQADAAGAAFDLLAGRPELDPHRIGLAGFSNGMWAVPMVAARRSDVAFLVGLGSPGVSMAESEVHRRVKAIRDAGVGESTQAAVARAWRCIFTIAAAGSADEQMIKELRAALEEVAVADDLDRYTVPSFARDNPMLSPIPPLVPINDLVAMLSGNPDTELTYDPAPDYARVSCPVFLQYGSEDTSVPVEASVEKITTALQGSRATQVIRVYPDLEHMLNVVPADVPGSSREAVMYAFHDFQFGPGVRQELTDWLTDNVHETPASVAPPAQYVRAPR